MRGSLSANALKDEGCKAVAAVLPQTQIKELKCAPAPATARQHLPPCAHLSAPHDIFHFSCTRHSLSLNFLKVEGGKAVAEALPKSSLTSLKCATGPGIYLMLPSPCVQRPAEHF